jgi:hypothetical protein
MIGQIILSVLMFGALGAIVAMSIVLTTKPRLDKDR